MKFWGYFAFILRETVSFGSRWCMIDGANFNIFECYNEFDRLQLSFDTGIIFSFLHVYGALVLFRGWSP